MKFILELRNLLFPKKNMNLALVAPLNPISRGIPVPTKNMEVGCGTCSKCEDTCPTDAIEKNNKEEIKFDYGMCIQCGICSQICSENKLIDSGFVYVFGLNRNELAVNYKNGKIQIENNFKLTQNQIAFQKLTKRSGFLYREVACGGNNTVESELNASFNSVFDSEREGVRSVASPKHADAIVFSGSVTRNMEKAFDKAYRVMNEPKALIACGTEAISGGFFQMGKKPVEPDLYIAGDPPRPDVILQGFRLLMGRIQFRFQIELQKFLESSL
ncbi:4Fe-4S dicluster domain-containing protein [Leptospira sp. 96542]|nr:4Fe-4S dicluster domain-containing protein [Leptospira sp. 96542]